MKHKYDIGKIIMSSLSARGLFYPGIFIPGLDKSGKVINDAKYNVNTIAPEEKLYTDKGSPLRNEDLKLGTYYFMPVYINKVEMPNAVISMSQSKVIIKTPLVGRNGTVKEFIAMDDFQIDVIIVLVGDNNEYPEKEIEQIEQLWRVNEAVEIISAITDMWLPVDSKVVLTDLIIDPVGEYENVQVISLKLISDINFELEIE